MLTFSEYRIFRKKSKGVIIVKINNIDINFIIEDFRGSEFFKLPFPININLEKYLENNSITLKKEEYEKLLISIREKL